MADSDISISSDLTESAPPASGMPSDSTTGYDSVKTSLDGIDLGMQRREPPTLTRSDMLALPALGAACFVHWRFRRHVPRRIPPLTTLRLVELYGTAGCIWMTWRENLLLKQKVMEDPDLLTIELGAWTMRHSYHYMRKRGLQITDDLKNPVPRMHGRTSVGDVPLRWFYPHIWSGPVEWNIAFAFVATQITRLMEQSKNFPSWNDVDVCVTHIANTMSSPWRNGHFVHCAVPFAVSFLGVTPFAMLARHVGPRMWSLGLNAVQRALFYTSVAVALAQDYQHWSYLMNLENKSMVASVLRAAAGPELERDVEEIMRIQKMTK